MTLSRRILTVVLVPLAALLFMAPVARPAPDIDLSRVRLELDETQLGAFKSFNGPGVSIDIVEFREGGDPGAARKIPGRVKYDNITLKRGYVNSSLFESWILQVRYGAPNFRKNLSLVILDRNGGEIGRYNLVNCWPASWKFSTLDGKGNDVVVEEVVIAVEYFEKA